LIRLPLRSLLIGLCTVSATISGADVFAQTQTPAQSASFPTLFVMLGDEGVSTPVPEDAAAGVGPAAAATNGGVSREEIPPGQATADELPPGRTSRSEADARSDRAMEDMEAADRAAAGRGNGDRESEDRTVERGEDDLLLSDVIASLYRSYPEIAAARQQGALANGQLLEAYGNFDTKLDYHSLNEPTGFYENYRHGIGVARNTWWGGYVAAGYRVGRGVFAPWYLERETETGGEFKVATVTPLLQGRAIDPNRVAVFQANLERQMAGPMVQQAILEASRDAAVIYWQWVAIGAILEAQRDLLELAEIRNEQFEFGVAAGKFAEIDLILNRQLVAERQAKLLETEQKFRETGFKLSLYLRNEFGQPLVPPDEWLPIHFPVIELPPLNNFQEDLIAALGRRPEPRLLQLEIRQIQFERQLASNQMLPRLDLVAEGSQDVGEPGSKSDDKGEFVLVIGVQGEVPIQRRKARGKLQQTTAKIVQLTEKLRLQENKIGAELQIAYNQLLLATEIVEAAETSLRAAFESLDRYRFAFDRGKVDLIVLNLVESKAFETEIKLVEAQQRWFESLANMQLALGLDPLDQAMVVSSLPASTRPMPADMPEPTKIDPEEFGKDWEMRGRPMDLNGVGPPAAGAAEDVDDANDDVDAPANE
jgi:outer membrane protein TolC